MRFAGTIAGAILWLGIATGAAVAVPAFVADEIELRWGPDEEFPAQAIVPPGTQVEVLECAGEWCRAAFQDLEGFLPREILNFLSPEPVPLLEEFRGYEFLDDGYVYGPGFAFPRFGGLHRRGESRATFHERSVSRNRFHSPAISGARFHSRAESAGRAHNRAFSGQVHSRFTSRGRTGEDRAPRRGPDRDRPDNWYQKKQDFRPKHDGFAPRREQDLQPRRQQDLQPRRQQDLQPRRQPDQPRRQQQDFRPKQPVAPLQKQYSPPPQKQRAAPPPQRQPFGDKKKN